MTTPLASPFSLFLSLVFTKRVDFWFSLFLSLALCLGVLDDAFGF